MRVAIGGIYHESNTFCSQPMTLAGFAEGQLDRGDAISGRWRGTASETAGFLAAADQFGLELVPTVMAWGMPAGAVTSETFAQLTGELVDGIGGASPLDGVLLSLHGAMVAEDVPDADGEILRQVRHTVGPGVPIVVTLDYHANVTQEMARWPDALIGYDTYPHVDQVERGLEAGALLTRMVREPLRPSMALARRPLLPHILSQATDEPPMSAVLEVAHAREARPEVLTASVFAGFPYTDVPDAGLAVVVVATRHHLASEIAEELAELAWSRRAEFARPVPSARQAITEALAAPAGLTVLVDVGDNVGAGTPGDGTALLAELLRQRARDALVLLCDPEAVETCVRSGVGERTTLSVGGKCDRHHGEPVELTGKVRLLSDGVFRNRGPMRDGILQEQGRTAVIDTGGVLVVLTERRMPMWNLEQLRSLGIEPTRLRIVVVKAAIAFRAAYAPIAARIIEVDTPGLSAADVRRFPYRRLRRPVYPLDPL